MVEAKAHRGELLKLNDASGATPASLDKIKTSFATARDYLGIPASVPAWEYITIKWVTAWLTCTG